MKIIDNKAVRLKLRNPQTVLTTIPESKVVGPHEVLVKWDVPQVHQLQAMNIKVPPPITGRYDWPGKFKPFSHQRTTAEFLTTHKKAFCFSDMGCVDSETEYLSPTGWVKISEYAGGMVAQYHPETRTFDFVSPEKYVKLPCENMIRVKTKYGVDQLLSAEHRVLLEDAKHNPEKRETLSAEQLLWRHNGYMFDGNRAKAGGTRAGTKSIAWSSAAVPTAFNFDGGTGIGLNEPNIRLMVAVIADGYFGSANTTHCAVRLKKQRKVSRLRYLLVKAGVDFEERPCLPEGFTKFTFYAPEKWKEFGDEWWNCTADELKIVTDEVRHWDSCVTRGFRFSTNCRKSADFIQFAFFATGATARVSTRDRTNEGKSVEHTVQIREGKQRLQVKSNNPTMWEESSTDGFKYCFMVPSTYLLFRRNGCVFASGNTGKTASAIWAADFLMKRGVINRALIICPVSIMDAAWRADLFSFAMHRRVDIAYGSADKRRKVIASDAEFVIINFDGTKVVEQEIADGGFDLIIVDEASAYKTATTKRWKTLRKLVRPETWLWMMTGTPAAQGPEDAFGLAKLVNPDGVPRTFTAYRDTVMFKVTQFKWEPKVDAVDTVHRILQPAIRFTKDECLDLPDMVYVDRHVDMTPQQRAYYDKLRKHLVIEAAGEQVTAVNAAVAMNKLLQISCGAVYTDDGSTLEFDIKNRYAVLKEVIDEAANKVIVFVPFQSSIEALSEKLNADKVTTEIINGNVPAGKRTEIFKRFQTTPHPRVLAVQPQAAAHGVTLTAADTIVWWSPTASLEIYAQANARIHRSGQKNKCTVVKLEGSAVERRLYEMLDKKLDVQSKIVKLYEEILA